MFWHDVWSTLRELALQFKKDVPIPHSCKVTPNHFPEALTFPPHSTALYYHAGVGTSSVSTFQLLDEYHDDSLDPKTGLPRYCSMWELQLELREIPSAISRSINLLEIYDTSNTQVDYSEPLSDCASQLDRPISVFNVEEQEEEEQDEICGILQQDNQAYHEMVATRRISLKSEKARPDDDESGYSSQDSSGKTSDSEDPNLNKVTALLPISHDVGVPPRHPRAKNASTVDMAATQSISRARGGEGQVYNEEAFVYKEEVLLTFTVPSYIAAMVAVAG